MPNITIEKKKKGKMYACFAFFPNGEVKRWKYVTNLTTFAQFLNKSHASWKYFNVYEKSTRAYLKRFYPGNPVPKTLGLLAITFGILSLASTMRNQTFDKHPYPVATCYPMKNTFSKTTFKVATPREQTFNNDFNYCATIPTPEKKKGGAQC